MSETNEPKSDKLKEVYGDRTVEDQRRIYREWAETYDSQTRNEFGWMGFIPAAEEFSKRVTDTGSRILDAGCGTGLSGVALARQGYENIHGRDLSPEMLAIAKETGAYKSLAEVDLTAPLPESGSFDAVIAVGVFGFGPPDPEHIPYLVAAAKPGCPVMLTVNGKGWIDRNWQEVLPQVVERSGLNHEETLDIPYLEKEEIDGKFLVFRA